MVPEGKPRAMKRRLESAEEDGKGKGGQGDVDPSSVFIRGLPKGTGDSELREWLEARVGPTVTCFVIRDDYGLVKFKHEADAQRCLTSFNGADYGGSNLRLSAAKPKRQRGQRPGPAAPAAPTSAATPATASSSGKGLGTKGPGKMDLRVVQLMGLPRDIRKEAVQSWIEKQMPGGCGIERISRVLEKKASGEGGEKQSLNAFIVTFRKEANARRALETLQGAELQGRQVTTTFRALEVSRASEKAGRLIVRNLNFSAQAKHLRKVFDKIGTLVDVHIPQKEGSTENRGFGFVQYADAATAERAVRELNGSKICGRGVAVDLAFDASLYHGLQKQEQQQREPRPAKRARATVSGDGEGQKEAKEEAKEEDREEAEEEEEEEKPQGGEEDEEAAVRKSHAEVDRMKNLLKESKGSDEEDEDDEEEAGSKKENKEKEDRQLRKPGYDVDDGCTVFLRNVPFDATEQDLRDSLRRFGRVARVKFVKDPTGQQAHRGTAFVKFADADGCSAALAAEAEADRKLKELSSVVRKSDQRELPAVEGFGISVKGRRLVLKPAVKPEEVTKLVDGRKPEKGAAQKERCKWMHLLHIGDIKDGDEGWAHLSPSEKRQRQASQKERRFRVNNSNFAIHPLRLSVRNLPASVTASKLREVVTKYLSQLPDIAPEGSKKMMRIQAAQNAITKASLVRDPDRRNADNERRSRGYGFIAFSEHAYAMKVLECLNDNPKAFGGNKRPIVQFAIEDKRKLRMQQDLYQKHAHKLLSKKGTGGKDEKEAPLPKGKGRGKGRGKGVGDAATADAANADAENTKSKLLKHRRKVDEDGKVISRGRRQREKRREQKARASEQAELKALTRRKRKKDVEQRAVQREIDRPKRPRPKRAEPDAGFASARKDKRPKVAGELSDDFELRAMERFRQAGY